MEKISDYKELQKLFKTLKIKKRNLIKIRSGL